MVDVSPIPSSWKLPGTSITVDPSQAGTPTNPKFALLVGHPLASAPAPRDVVTAIGTQADANAYFGAGSMLARQFAAFFAINRSSPLFALPVAEPSSGVAATGTLTVSAAPTVAGTLSLYIAGQKVAIAIASADTAANVATKIAAAITAAPDLPVTASASSAAVTLTAKWKGLTGNDIRVEANYLGFYGGEFYPSSLTLTFPTDNVLSGGTGTPDFTAAIANLGDAPYRFVSLPHTDSGSRALWATEYGFSDSGRWGWMRQSYGQIWSARRDTYSGHMTWGPTANDPVIYTMGIEPQSPTPMWEWSAVFAANAALYLTADPARPLQTLTMNGCLPAPKSFRFNKTQLNAMATVGIAIQGTDLDGNTGGVPQILREQSSYQRNTQGQADNAYELATTLATLDEVFTRLRQAISNKFPRHKLADNGTRFGAGQAIVTPLIIKGELVAQYRIMENDGLVENATAFKNALVVERSTKEPNTVEVLYPPDLINQLRRLNIKCQFRLQFPLALAA
ncbi:phage tail sheath C-terminal domain-containing protein [Methylobacterium dankookense]|uniref:Uncharacterized protein n=1 Tax=Methylobacterium dankookense TaxID=560405 RepID=A0A564G5P3_9HYPH|nr:phage tail sheath C-terminal domain-containing protein [Methylobacterium dankookense]GJD58358.1 hypothetical protein IFDJLNFL_4277 [Methylobacterium dankookense]VUF15637.1 hypothetical protein MTDSW087_05381 [Methylobacterium dankookense]